jgi:hypothetical protein
VKVPAGEPPDADATQGDADAVNGAGETPDRVVADDAWTESIKAAVATTIFIVLFIRKKGLVN